MDPDDMLLVVDGVIVACLIQLRTWALCRDCGEVMYPY